MKLAIVNAVCSIKLAFSSFKYIRNISIDNEKRYIYAQNSVNEKHLVYPVNKGFIELYLKVRLGNQYTIVDFTTLI